MALLSLALVRAYAVPALRKLRLDFRPVKVFRALDDRLDRAWDRAVKYLESSRLVFEIRYRLEQQAQLTQDLSRAVIENGPDELKLIPQGVQHPPETEALLRKIHAAKLDSRLLFAEVGVNESQPVGTDAGLNGRVSASFPT